MKYKVTKRELNECIAEAVVKVLKEDNLDMDVDEFIRQIMSNKSAQKSAMADINNEISQSEKENEKLQKIEKEKMDTSDDDIVDTSKYKTMKYEKLIELHNNPKNKSQSRAVKSELANRNRIKKEFEEDGIKPEYGYTIDANGNVQPTHTSVGTPGLDAWGTNQDNSGLSHRWGGGISDN